MELALSEQTYEIEITNVDDGSVENDSHLSSESFVSVHDTTTNYEDQASTEIHSNGVEDVQTSILQIETNTSVVIVTDVNDISMDYSDTATLMTGETEVVIENVTSVDVYEDISTINQDENIIVVEGGLVSLYANDNTTSELIATESIVTITDTEIFVDKNESEKNKRKFDNLSTPNPPPVVLNAWDTCEEVEANWYHLDWFGYFFRTSNSDWIYDARLGWIYVDFTTTFDSVWIFHDSLGWVWISQNVFPYVFEPSSNSWFYLSDVGYYDFNLSKWVKFN